MTVELSGQRLTLDEVVRVARAGETVALADEALVRMRERRAVVERVAQDGTRDVRRHDRRRNAPRRDRGHRGGARVQPLGDLRPSRRARLACSRGRRTGIALATRERRRVRAPGCAAPDRRGADRDAQPRWRARRAVARHGRPGRSRAERRPRPRRVAETSSSRRARRSRSSSATPSRPGRPPSPSPTRARCSTGSTPPRALDFEALRANVGALHPEVGGRPPVSRDRRDADPDARAARGQRPVGARCRALPPGSAHVPLRAAGTRRGA